MSENTNTCNSNSDAEFIGWQKNSHGRSFALYNITSKDHPSFGSTVTKESLRDMNLKIPEVPKSDNIL